MKGLTKLMFNQNLFIMAKKHLSPEDKLMAAIYGKPLSEITKEEMIEAKKMAERKLDEIKGKAS